MRTSTKVEIFAATSAVGTGAALTGQWLLVAILFAAYVLLGCIDTIVHHRERAR